MMIILTSQSILNCISHKRKFSRRRTHSRTWHRSDQIMSVVSKLRQVVYDTNVFTVHPKSRQWSQRRCPSRPYDKGLSFLSFPLRMSMSGKFLCVAQKTMNVIDRRERQTKAVTIVTLLLYLVYGMSERDHRWVRVVASRCDALS